MDYACVGSLLVITRSRARPSFYGGVRTQYELAQVRNEVLLSKETLKIAGQRDFRSRSKR